MPIVLILLVLFIVVPLIEVMTFIEVGGIIGLWPTILLCLLTAAVGTALIRHQGLSLIRTASEQINAGKAPVFEVFSGICLLLAGVMLLTPGFVTDTIGFLLLIPPLRQLLYKRFEKRMVVEGNKNARQNGTPSKPKVIDVDFEEIDEKDMPPPSGGWNKRQ